VAGVNINQTVMAVVAVLAIVGLILRHTLKKSEKVDGSGEGEAK
jgi:hypothetical protein